MKLQIQGQSLRLRVDEAELAALLAGEVLVNATRFGSAPGAGLRQVLQLQSIAEAAFRPAPAEWQIALPEAAVHDYAATLPCRNALRFDLVFADGERLSIAFEVDIRDSLQVRGARRRSSGRES